MISERQLGTLGSHKFYFNIDMQYISVNSIILQPSALSTSKFKVGECKKFCFIYR